MYENVKEYLEWARKKVDEEIPKLADELKETFLLDVEDVFRGGKRFRPSLTLLVAQAIAGKDAWKDAIDYALAIEMIHSFSLNVDDILDMDTIRRGRPSEWVVHGLLPAFLTGIGGITQAFSLGSKNHKAMQVLNETIQAMASGAVKEMITGNVFKRDFLLNIIVLKTGALMATATQMGAIAVGAPSYVEEAFRKYGLNVGIAYQMQDDLNDIIVSIRDGEPKGDLRDHRLTLPLYIIHNSVPSLATVIDLFLNRKISFKNFADKFLTAGGLDLFGKVNDEIENYIGKAIHSIKDLELQEEYKEILTDLPYYMIDAMRKEALEKWRRPLKKVEIEEEEEEEEESLSYEDWIKTLPPTLIAATSLLQMKLSDEDIIEKTGITDKELEYLKEMLKKYGILGGERND